MASSNYRMTVYLGSGDEGKKMKDDLVKCVWSDTRFQESEAEFVRQAIKDKINATLAEIALKKASRAS